MAEQEHRIIYLEPRCVGKSGEDRHWCQNDAWGTCDECGTPSVKYIIASEHADLVKALEEAALQLEYMQERMPTGTSAAVLTRINHLLSGVKSTGVPDHG